jgi:hypothetical protein
LSCVCLLKTGGYKEFSKFLSCCPRWRCNSHWLYQTTLVQLGRRLCGRATTSRGWPFYSGCNFCSVILFLLTRLRTPGAVGFFYVLVYFFFFVSFGGFFFSFFPFAIPLPPTCTPLIAAVCPV